MNETFLHTTVYQPLLPSPLPYLKGKLDLPVGSIVKLTMNAGTWAEVQYQTNFMLYTGWIRSDWAEEFVQDGTPVLKIKNGTLSKSDGNQYIFYNGITNFNLCGPMCVAMAAGWTDFDVEDWFDHWQEVKPKTFSDIFRPNGNRTTGISDLDAMLDTFEGYKTPSIRIQDVLYERNLQRSLITPGRLKLALNGRNSIIASCTIEKQFGQLKPSGTLHWILVEEVVTQARGGLVKFYNPFGNIHEWASWNEFNGAIHSPYGIVVPN